MTKTGDKLDFTGDAQTPAKVSTTDSTVSMAVPSGSVVSIDKNGNSSVTVSEQTEIRVKTVTENVTGPVTRAPPSQSEIAKGKSLQWFYIAGLAFAVGALFCFYSGHVKAGVVSGCGALTVPMLGNFLSSDAGQKACIVFGCVSLSLVAAWFFLKRKYPDITC